MFKLLSYQVDDHNYLFFSLFRHFITETEGTSKRASIMSSSSTECISWLSVVVTECVAVLVINLVTIVVFMKNRNLRRRSLYLVLNLAVADMLVGGLSTIHLFAILSFFCNHWFYSSISLPGKTAISFLFYFGPLSSMINIAVISLERLHATFRPFRHRCTKKWVYGVTIAVVWIVAAAVSTTLVVLWKAKLLSIPYYYFWQSLNLICLFIICVSYAAIVMKMYCTANPHHHGAAGRERKLTMTLLIVTVVSLLLYLPKSIGTFLFFSTDTFTSLPFLTVFRINVAFILLYYANSLVNPLVYAIRMPDFKKSPVFHLWTSAKRKWGFSSSSHVIGITVGHVEVLTLFSLGGGGRGHIVPALTLTNYNF